MKDFELEILNAGSSENISLLSEESMNGILGGAVQCKKGYSAGDNGDIACGCGYTSICGGGCPIDRIKRARGESANVCSKYKNGLSRILPVLYHKLKMKK